MTSLFITDWHHRSLSIASHCQSEFAIGPAEEFCLQANTIYDKKQLPFLIFINTFAGQMPFLLPTLPKHWREHTHSRHCLVHTTHTFNGPLSRTTRVKPIWILLKQETVSGSGISWAICKSASRSRQRTTPASHHSVFYRPDALPATQPTASKH